MGNGGGAVFQFFGLQPVMVFLCFAAAWLRGGCCAAIFWRSKCDLFSYFRAGMGAESLLVCALYALMGFSPMIIEAVEWLRWSFIQ